VPRGTAVLSARCENELASLVEWYILIPSAAKIATGFGRRADNLNSISKTQLGGAPLAGDFSALCEQLGANANITAMVGRPSLLGIERIDSVEQLQKFLGNYRTHLLLPWELPSIQRAFQHTTRNELQELIVYDRDLARQPILQEIAAASQRVGHSHLKRLRPLRDQRFARRYLSAVELGEAHGWHTLVYGIVLHVYSLPLYEGLMAYAYQTLRGFVRTVAPHLHLSEAQSQELFVSSCAELPALMAKLPDALR
jgi:urease accessory protein UreF